MARIQVAGIRDFSGTGKESGRAYKMRIVKVIATDNDGVVEVGELSFFEREGSPLPVLEVGKSYEPIVGFKADKGKLTTEILSLRPVQAVARAA